MGVRVCLPGAAFRDFNSICGRGFQWVLVDSNGFPGDFYRFQRISVDFKAIFSEGFV